MSAEAREENWVSIVDDLRDELNDTSYQLVMAVTHLRAVCTTGNGTAERLNAIEAAAAYLAELGKSS